LVGREGGPRRGGGGTVARCNPRGGFPTKKRKICKTGRLIKASKGEGNPRKTVGPLKGVKKKKTKKETPKARSCKMPFRQGKTLVLEGKENGEGHKKRPKRRKN